MTTQPILLTPKEAGRLLRLSKSKMHQLIVLGTIPSVKIGRSRRIPIDDLVRYLTLLRLAQVKADVDNSGIKESGMRASAADDVDNRG